MIKFIIPAIIVFLIVLFWEKIQEFFYNKFNIKIKLYCIGYFCNNFNYCNGFIIFLI